VPALNFWASRSSALLADDMGLGKSVQVCGLLNHRPDLRSCLIVSPACMKTCWHRELSRWLLPSPLRSVSIVLNSKESLHGDIVVVNYDLLGKLHASLAKRSWDLVVYDEGHYLKNRQAQRTIFAKGLAHGARMRVILTGTPLLNRPAELWS